MGHFEVSGRVDLRCISGPRWQSRHDMLSTFISSDETSPKHQWRRPKSLPQTCPTSLHKLYTFLFPTKVSSRYPWRVSCALGEGGGREKKGGFVCSVGRVFVRGGRKPFTSVGVSDMLEHGAIQVSPCSCDHSKKAGVGWRHDMGGTTVLFMPNSV